MHNLILFYPTQKKSMQTKIPNMDKDQYINWHKKHGYIFYLSKYQYIQKYICGLLFFNIYGQRIC